MAPRRSIEVKLAVPEEIREVGFKLQVSPQDLDLKRTWLDYFRIHEPESLFNKVISVCNGHYVIRNQLSGEKQKSFELNKPIKDFIDSFHLQYIRLTYCATLIYVSTASGSRVNANATQPAKPLVSTSSGVGTPRANTMPPRNGIVSTTKRRNPNNNGIGPERLAKTARNNFGEEINLKFRTRSNNQFKASPSMDVVSIENDLDDTASMADSIDSQDSQQDLIEAGVRNKDIIPNVVHNLLKHVDKITMLRIRLELQKLKEERKWFKASHYAPNTFNALHVMFNIQ